MCVSDPPPRPAGRRFGHVAALVVVVALSAFALRAAATGPVNGAGADVQALAAGTRAMIAAIGTLPEPAALRIGGDVHALAGSIDQALVKLRQLPAPFPDPEIAHDLRYLRDLVEAATAELELAGRGEADPLAAAWQAQVDRLASAGKARLAQVDIAADRWIGHMRRSIVTIEERPDALIVTSIDRLAYDGARAAGTALFLIGLLVLGYQLLTVGDGGLGLLGLIRHAPLMSSAGVAGVALFMAGSFVLGTDPSALVDLSAHRQVQTREHPCQVLAVENRQLRQAQKLESARLVGLVEERMAGAARTCLGLDSDMAAAEVVGVLAARAEQPVTLLQARSLSEPAQRAPGQPDGEDEMPADLDRAVEIPQEGPVAEAPGVAAAGVEPLRLAAVQVAEAGPAQAEAANASIPDEAAAGATGPIPMPAPRDFITTTDVNFRAGPSPQADRLGTLPRGTSVRMVSDEGRWSVVRLSDGRAGYVATNFLRPAH